ncbi:hypothetical protein GYMLUDRAFT_156342 [Collybiopsis luxurians FD-317 M1]|nr:hypothetical protein GYMLUDRAFT_156342 [Collybiopsis luxurians FD-317 M1]
MHTFVAVHGGAGSHNSSSEKEIKQALRLACKNALQSGSSLDATEAAIMILEDDPNFNAGFSSNLTLDGSVECDAAIMDGRNHFGSVGAISGVKNPIRVARALLNYSQVPDPLGRIPPLTLVSSGAHHFASENPHTRSGMVDHHSMISERARDRWHYWKNRLTSVNSAEDTSNDVIEDESLHDLQDTVGAVISCSGEMAAGVSSGGLLLKLSGRCGEAAVFGAGCWAQNICAGSQMGMACSISGTGEFIMRSSLARALGKAFETSNSEGQDEEVDPHAIIQKILVDEFWKLSQDLGEPSPNAGILLMTYEDGHDNEPIARLWCAFTTPSMAIAYASSKNPNPKSLVLRRPKSKPETPSDKASVYVTAFSL